MDQLDTKHLLLRPMAMADCEALFAYRSDKVTNQYQGWIPETMDDVVEFICRLAPDWNLPDTWSQLSIVERLSGEVIGDIGVHFIDLEGKQVELGCTLDKKQQGKGFATEALTALINYLFREMDKHRIIGSVDPRNKSSVTMLNRLGFRKEAHFRESYFQNNEWFDDAIYALLKADWVN